MPSKIRLLDHRLLEGIRCDEIDDQFYLLVLVRRLRRQWAVAIRVSVHLRVGKQLRHMVGYDILAQSFNVLAFEGLLDTLIVVLLLPAHKETRHRYRLREELWDLIHVPRSVWAHRNHKSQRLAYACVSFRSEHHREVRALREAHDPIEGSVLLNLRPEPREGISDLLITSPILVVEFQLIVHHHGLPLEEHSHGVDRLLHVARLWPLQDEELDDCIGLRHQLC
mmetsp:Transcript_133716/g.285924  ORF Transcript_133716/g.285924 Transcript_133716/m.285924 type:complete len:224 (+) Transcript_133716:67-738(+)